MNIRTVDCKNVKCYLLKCSNGYLMFDASWPHQYTYWKDSVKSLGISPKEIKTKRLSLAIFQRNIIMIHWCNLIGTNCILWVQGISFQLMQTILK